MRMPIPHHIFGTSPKRKYETITTLTVISDCSGTRYDISPCCNAVKLQYLPTKYIAPPSSATPRSVRENGGSHSLITWGSMKIQVKPETKPARAFGFTRLTICFM